MIKTDGGFMKMEHKVKKEPGFGCSVEGCDRRFERRARLDKHIVRAHTKREVSPRKIYKCDHCSYVSYKPSHFRQHLKIHLPDLEHIVTVI